MMVPRTVLLTLALVSAGGGAAQAAPTASNAFGEHNNLDVLWTCVAAFLVFFMQAGFALVEAGFTQARNAVNIVMKNVMDFALGTIAFFVVGFALMFGVTNGFCGTTLFALDGVTGADWGFTFLIFQTVFAATAATIVSGAMAERTKFSSYLLYSIAISAVIYPVYGSWAWGGLLDGGGWLEGLTLGGEETPFLDFAGSTVVHSVGGWLALAGALVLGARRGKYGPDRRPRAIMGHSIPLAALGVFILWLGWFGFNAGSTNVADGSIGRIAVTTNLAAAGGALAAMLCAWLFSKKPDASMTLNGVLAGLVAITAGCDAVSPWSALAIGLAAGVICYGSVLLFDRVLRVDDPVGAVSVHGVCGAWGTLAVGLFHAEQGLFFGGGATQLAAQAIGVLAAFGWAFGCGLALFVLLKKTVGLRVSAEAELKGLDISEHGMEAYGGFQFFRTL